MFGIGGTEIVLIALFALLIFGPDKLPKFARTAGKFIRELRRYQAMMESTLREEILQEDKGTSPGATDTLPSAPPAAPAASVTDEYDDEEEEEEEE